MNNRPNEAPRPRYPIDYSALTPRGVKRTIPQWDRPDLNRGFAADDSGEFTVPGAFDWNSAPPPHYTP
jgi:hypothetical protein